MSMQGDPITLPTGVGISPGRETVQSGPNGQNVQGMMFSLTIPGGAQTSVFVPYDLMQYPDQVTALFAKRVAGIQAVQALSGG
jgi:hypothetical protein